MTGGEIKNMRLGGFIPATISTRGGETQSCVVNHDQLTEILSAHGNSAIIEIKGTAEGGSVLVIPRDIQKNAVTRKIIHVGFQRVSASDPITAEVRVVLTGEPNDVKIGVGFLEQLQSKVQIRAVPDKLPEHVEVDTTNMVVGSVLTAASLAVGKAYTVVTAPETVIAVLHSMTRGGAKEDEPAVAEAPAT
jgi:large subunit ribosomal protein L25